jgi:hypothetical protein
MCSRYFLIYKVKLAGQLPLRVRQVGVLFGDVSGEHLVDKYSPNLIISVPDILQ